MQHLQRALLVADGRELVRALERILGFLCGERVSSLCGVCVLLRRLDGVAVRVSHRLRVVAERALPRTGAVRSTVIAVPTRPRIISRTALRRAFLGRTPGAHVKVLVSHDASEGARCASLVAGAASRRATLNLWLRA